MFASCCFACPADLFHRAIVQSGSPLAFWATHADDVNLLGFFNSLSTQLGCHRATVERTVDCLRHLQPWHKLVDVKHHVSFKEIMVAFKINLHLK